MNALRAASSGILSFFKNAKTLFKRVSDIAIDKLLLLADKASNAIEPKPKKPASSHALTWCRSKHHG